VTLTLFGARRRLLGNADLEAAEQLMTFGGTAMGNAAEYGEAQRTALQLRASADSRAVVDEARVQLMRTLGCDWDEALDRMKQISQATNLKVTEVASRIVSSGGLAGSM
jgi:AmiR/NasT family two-component response regulator